ncbi:TraI domain-containing protein [Xenorhabdus bovienii]|uniref:Putative relaxase n=1 Tax=Xenorhabdus bovienii TaxID=40576 RepID=A0A0B6X906_XENBV|nr:TraI domain-containing protein [Xenorhabdus bovienii]CDM88744.1 Putative relaxase [Xenorhabdus bovienii]
MFARFKSHFTRPPAPQKKSSEQKTSEVRDNGGYFRPQSADALLATPLRRQCLQQLWQNSTLPEGLYQRFYLAPVKQLLGSVQQVPAAPEGDWSGRGGFADLTMQFTTCAVRLAKGSVTTGCRTRNAGSTECLMADGRVLGRTVLSPAAVAAA